MEQGNYLLRYPGTRTAAILITALLMLSSCYSKHIDRKGNVHKGWKRPGICTKRTKCKDCPEVKFWCWKRIGVWKMYDGDGNRIGKTNYKWSRVSKVKHAGS